jgi:hypothetical protein
MLALVLIAGMLQQQPQSSVAERRQASAENFDSTTAQVVTVASGVAEVKSSLDLFRRAVFNGPDGDVLMSAGAFAQHCQHLQAEALDAVRKVCRHCGSPEVQRALEGYRRAMPGLARGGASCSARISRLLGAPAQHDAAAALRRDVRVIGQTIVDAVVPYEERLHVLREAAGWAHAAAPPATRAPRTQPAGP